MIIKNHSESYPRKNGRLAMIFMLPASFENKNKKKKISFLMVKLIECSHRDQLEF